MREPSRYEDPSFEKLQLDIRLIKLTSHAVKVLGTCLIDDGYLNRTRPADTDVGLIQSGLKIRVHFFTYYGFIGKPFPSHRKIHSIPQHN